MSRRNPEQDLERLLDDDRGDFGTLYGRLSRAEPPRRLDRAILAEASRAVRGSRPPRAQRWLFGIGSAAGLVLAAGIAWQVGQQIDSKDADMASGAARQGVPAVVPVQPIAPTAAPAEPPHPPAIAPPGISDMATREAKKPPADAERARREVRAKAAKPEAAPPPPAAPPPLEMAAPAAAAPMPAEEVAPVAAADASVMRADTAMEAEKRAEGAAGQGSASQERKSSLPSTATLLRSNVQLPPAAWIAEIRRLVDAGRHQQAVENLRLFRRLHPDWPLDEDLRRLDE